MICFMSINCFDIARSLMSSVPCDYEKIERQVYPNKEDCIMPPLAVNNGLDFH